LAIGESESPLPPDPLWRLAEPYDASSIGPGWHYYLDRLDAVVADTAVPDKWDDYYPALQDAYSAPSYRVSRAAPSPAKLYSATAAALNLATTASDNALEQVPAPRNLGWAILGGSISV
jgi:hypothetical protein